MRKSIVRIVLLVAWATTYQGSAIVLLVTTYQGSAEESLKQQVSNVIDQTEARQNEMLRSMLKKPSPAGLWGVENFALAAYWLNEETVEADAGLIASVTNGLYEGQINKVNFHWHAYLQQRIYFLFSSRSKYFPGRMGIKAENAVLEMLWNWAAPHCRKEMALLDRVWWSWSSENHHIQAWVGFWGAAQIFKDHPDYRNRKYADGSTPAEMAVAFDEYFKRYARERASKGLVAEIASPTYSKYTINTWYNLADFSEDPVLKERMNSLLDLCWADWAVEQINGMRGGSRHRCYPGSPSIQKGGGLTGLSWYHFGLEPEAIKHPGVMCAATTFWRPSPVVAELALDTVGRGDYAYISRRPGLAEPKGEENILQETSSLYYRAKDIQRVNPEGGDLLRYTWCTPNFVMGMSQVPSLPSSAWTAFSSQNRWNGVIFSGNSSAQIFTQPYKRSSSHVYNSEWGVQNKGVMILQRLKTAKGATGQRIWFDKSLKISETNGWVFVEAPNAYAAVRIINGGGAWQADSTDQQVLTDLGEWLVLNDEFSPVVIEVAHKTDYADFSLFQTATHANSIVQEGNYVEYHSSLYKTVLTLFIDASKPPRVDGAPVNFSPEKVYDSPYIQGNFGNGTVSIQKNGETVILDFTRE